VNSMITQIADKERTTGYVKKKGNVAKISFG